MEIQLKVEIGLSPELSKVADKLLSLMIAPTVLAGMSSVLSDLKECQENDAKARCTVKETAVASTPATTDSPSWPVPSESSETPVATTPAPVVEEKPAEKPKGKAGRKPKETVVAKIEPELELAQPASKLQVEEPIEEPALVDDLTGAPLAPTNGHDKTYTKEDLIAATENAVYRSKGNREKIREYLDEAQFNKVTDLPESNWPAFIQFAETL